MMTMIFSDGQTFRDVKYYKDGPSISFPVKPSTITELDVAILALGTHTQISLLLYFSRSLS